MNTQEQDIFKIAEHLWMNDYPFKINHDNTESPAIILETKNWYVIETCPEEELMLSRFNRPIYIGKSVSTILDMLYYLLKEEREKEEEI